MNLIKAIPNIHYINISEGVKLFIDTLDFEIIHKEESNHGKLFLIKNGGITLRLIEDNIVPENIRPEFRFVTDNIGDIYQHIIERNPDYLHPNENKISKKPWGALEFALLDKTGLCIVFQDWN